MFGKFKVAHLLGSTKGNEKQFREVETALTKMGYIVFAPVIYSLSIYKQYPDLLDNMCYEKLLVSDICVIATPDYIGESTRNRIRQAIEFGKPAYIWNNGLKKFDVSEYKSKLKVDIYIYNLTEVNGKFVYEITPTYLGFAEVDKFDADEIFHLCNWSCWTQEKPDNLHADIDYCGHGLCLVNPITQQRYLAKSVGWMIGDRDFIDKYVMVNRYHLTYWG